MEHGGYPGRDHASNSRTGAPARPTDRRDATERRHTASSFPGLAVPSLAPSALLWNRQRSRVTLRFVGNQQQQPPAGSWETYKPPGPTKPSEHPDALESVCAECGDPFRRRPGDTRSRCYECKPTAGTNYPVAAPERKHGTTSQRGYDTAWRRLSERARALQPWCSDCGRRDDLTTDHTPAAWARRAAGRAIRLADVEVESRNDAPTSPWCVYAYAHA